MANLAASLSLIASPAAGPPIRRAAAKTNSLPKKPLVFAVCAGFQIVGEQFPDASNVGHEGLGLLERIMLPSQPLAHHPPI